MRFCPDNKELYLISGADHTDLYDGGKDKVIPFAKIVDFFPPIFEINFELTVEYNSDSIIYTLHRRITISVVG